MSDWVEYCNLAEEGLNAKLRISNGQKEPYGVKYWSIGNENYGAWEIGAKTVQEWPLLVTEAAKMMKRVDPGIQLSAAALPDVEWNLALLSKAGEYLDWISIHEYWDAIHQTNALATYEETMAYTAKLDDSIRKVEGILEATGYIDKIKISFDEWNLRGWYHPNSHTKSQPIDKSQYITPRDKNDDNSSYTMADTVFTACFLNTLLRHCNTVKMANFAPTVNTRGMIFTHPNGIVLRGMYHVFDLFVNHMGETVVDLWQSESPVLQVKDKWNNEVTVPQLDIVATLKEDKNVAISIINKDANNAAQIAFHSPGFETHKWKIMTISGSHVDDFNDIDNPDNIQIKTSNLTASETGISVNIPAHSVNVLTT
jgi:alpha-N-arabinofuranosidase